MTENEKLRKVSEVAKQISTSRQTVYKLIKKGKLKAVYVTLSSKRLATRIPESEVSKLVNERK